MLGTIAILATASTAAALITGARVFGLKRLVKHSTKTDVVFTAGIGFALAGTLTGLATAIVAGLMMAAVLSLLKGAYRVVRAVKRGVRNVRAIADEPMIPECDWEYNNDVYTRGLWEEHENAKHREG